MIPTLEALRRLVATGEVRISEHGYDELSEDGIRARKVIDSVGHAIEIEDYPTFPKGPAVLALRFDGSSLPVHVVWGIPKGFASPAVLIAAYRPDPR